ncbi:MAG: response regulator [Candidatus Eisenbacteria bacterium]|nr:response regulator [Candidatus Eisenbacteria bacterium]
MPTLVTRTILAVEDQPAARRLIYHALKGSFRLLEAGDAGSAIALLEREPVDLVLLDLHLPPDLDSPQQGLEVERRVRALPREVPLVVMSANEDPALRETLLARGARAFLRKPVDPDRLLEVVQRLLAT